MTRRSAKPAAKLRSNHGPTVPLWPLVAERWRDLRGLHRNQEGTISIVSVFSIMLLAMLLGMVMNVGKQVDGKVKMQNAADAAAYSSGIVLARNMNTLAFTNHLLCDICGVTAFLREASQHNAEQMVPPILAAWSKVGPVFAQSGFAKFNALGPAITQKVPLEQQMVTAYGKWADATAQLILPTWEQVLKQELIPKFQRSLLLATPQMAQTAAAEITRRHGLGSPERGVMGAAVWHASGNPLLNDSQMNRRTLPVIDPESDGTGQQTASQQRHNLAHAYLNQWNDASLVAFDQVGKMSQFGTLWRGFTCGQLDKLLNQDYPNSNLPMLILPQGASEQPNNYLDDKFNFVVVAYWPQATLALPGLFKNPIQSDAMAIAETTIFVPRQRLVRNQFGGQQNNLAAGANLGGVPGDMVNLPPPANAPAVGGNGAGANNNGWIVVRESKPTNWDLLNQNWSVKLVPAAGAGMMSILTTTPPGVSLTANGSQRAPRVLSLTGVTAAQLSLVINN